MFSRRGFIGAIAALFAAGASPASAGESDNTVPAPWTIVVQEVSRADGGCSGTAFLQVSEVPGATSYAIDIFDTNPQVNRGETKTGPPFPSDTEQVGDQVVRAPGGTHRWGLSGFDQGAPCTGGSSSGFLAPSRWRVTRAVAFVDDRPRVSGTVRNADGSPAGNVAIAIRGPSRATARTNASGSYSTRVRRGTYRVSAPAGYCVAGARACTSSKTVRVSGPATVDFAKRNVRLSGHVTLQSCGATSCSRGGLPGVTVTALGPGQPTTTTTTGDGSWSMTVPTGDYRVSAAAPNRIFEPEEEDVEADADKSGIDFLTCAHAGAARVRGAGGVPRSPCDPDGLDWEMAERFTAGSASRWPSDGLPDFLDVNPTKWTLHVFPVKDDLEFNCLPDTRWRYRVVAPRGARVTHSPDPGCRERMEVDRLGTYRVTAVKQVRKRGRWSDARPRVAIEQRVVVKDLLVVGMGDSNGSGEGNPLSFYYHRCNRGTASYQYKTALAVEKADARTSVTFIHTSCSGASTRHLYDQGYLGIRKRRPPLDPQITQVNEKLTTRLRRDDPVRKVDAVILSIGVNDLEFGAIMKLCVDTGFNPAFWSTPGVAPCEDRRVIGHADDPEQEWKIDHYEEATNGERLTGRLARLQRALPAKLGRVGRALKAPVDDGGLGIRDGSKVFAASYPDFSRDDNEQTCSTGPPYGGQGFIARMPPSTWGWLGGNADLLNARVRAGASQSGWTAVPISAEFRRHGYCARDSYFFGIWQAVDRLDIAGPFHPIDAGHLLEANETLPLVCKELFDNDRCISRRP